MPTAADNIRLIESIFREVQDNLSTTTPLQDIAKLVSNYPSVFRSVAYEAASMHLALRGIKQGDSLVDWEEFLETYALRHRMQYYIGLGWALAQEQVNPRAYCKMWSNHVAGGYGYYEGMFRKRKIISQKLFPHWKDDDLFKSYLQGLGRSVWYVYVADYTQVEQTINSFPESYQTYLWYGLGVAVAYVGIADDYTRFSLKRNRYWESIRTGILQAVQTGRTSERGAYLDVWCSFAL